MLGQSNRLAANRGDRLARAVFVEPLDADDLAATADFALPPVMIHGDDVTHVITEQGVANRLLCRSPDEREAALRAIAGDTEFGRVQLQAVMDDLRRRGIVMRPSDLEIDARAATRDPFAAQTIDDLVACSGRLYEPPPKFRRRPRETVATADIETSSKPVPHPAAKEKDMTSTQTRGSRASHPGPSWLDRLRISLGLRNGADAARHSGVVAPLDRAKRLATALLSERGAETTPPDRARTIRSRAGRLSRARDEPNRGLRRSLGTQKQQGIL